MMYSLIKKRVASKYELESVYTLDEALKLYALIQMEQDIEYCQNQDAQKELQRR